MNRLELEARPTPETRIGFARALKWELDAIDKLERGATARAGCRSTFALGSAAGADNYIHATDLASAHVAATKALDARRTGFDVMNVVRGQGVTVRKVLRSARSVTGIDVAPVVVGRRAVDTAAVVASAERISRELDWRAVHDLTRWWSRRGMRGRSCLRLRKPALGQGQARPPLGAGVRAEGWAASSCGSWPPSSKVKMRKETSATTSRIKPRAEHPRGLIRTAVEAHIERRRQDPEFMARLKARIDQDQRLLAKLAKN